MKCALKFGTRAALLSTIVVLASTAGCTDGPSPLDPLPAENADFRQLDALLPQADTSVAVPPVFAITGDTISITEFGATPNDDIDDTDAIQRAVLRTGHIHIPAGRYQISRPIRLPSDTRVYGTGRRSVIRQTDPKSSAFVVAGSPIAFAENISVEHLSIESGPSSAFALDVVGARNVAFLNNTVRGLGMVHTGVPYPIQSWDRTPDPTATAGLIRESQLTSDIWVLGNSGDGLSPAGAREAYGVLLTYSRRAYVENNSARNYAAGIQWWGGDADPSRGGGLNHDNPRWARGLWIRGNLVEGVDVSAIWGSMGERIAVTRNVVQDCLDVCLDAEGSNDVLFARNRARNARNGVLAVFFHSRNVRFILNEAEQDGSLGHTLFVRSNYDQLAGETSIALAHNTLAYTGPEGVGEVIKGASRNFLMDSNTLTDVRIATEANNSGSARILNNVLTFTRPITAAAISVGGNYGATRSDSAVIAGNRISSSATQETAPALLAHQSVSTQKVQTTVRANEIRNFRHAIVAQSSGTAHHFSITDNEHDGSIEVSGSPRPTTNIARNTLR